jgi:hypothetical protein
MRLLHTGWVAAVPLMITLALQKKARRVTLQSIVINGVASCQHLSLFPVCHHLQYI